MSGDILAAREVENHYHQSGSKDDIGQIYFNYPSKESNFLAYSEFNSWLIEIHKLVKDIGEYEVSYREDQSTEMLAKGFAYPETVNRILLNDLEDFYHRWDDLKKRNILPDTLSEERYTAGEYLKKKTSGV